MKKLLFSVVALATLLLAGSCQKENFGSANGNTVAYTVKLPGNIATKAIGDDLSSVTKLVYAVYRTDAQTANDYSATETLLYQKTATLTNGQATLYPELVNNQNFRILFWAQDPNAGIYDASNLKNVTIDYTNLDANQESYAAFAGSDFIKSGDNLSGRTVYLHRAVAQLNIATTPESMVLGEAGANETSSLVTNVTLTTSQVTVNGLASTYNVADASVGEILTADFEFDATDPSVLSEQTLDVKGVTYKYISMNYVGFAPAMGTDVEVDYEIVTNVGTITNTISSVPVKPNYRTNIIGNLITSTSDYTVILDKEWDGTHFNPTDVNAAQVALDAAENGTIIKLNPGVNYGTLVFRQNASSKVVDITTAGGDAAGNEKYRRIENLTIIGAEGAVVDGFDFQVGWIAGSGASYIDINNLKVQNVTFSGSKTPFNFEGSKGSSLGIDGLTIDGCKMVDANNNNRFVFQQISGYKELIDKTSNEYVMTTGIKNLTITDCEVVGAYMVIESRAMENLTITDNIFRGIKARDMLITSDTSYHPEKTYTGYITITGNQSFDGEERFVRASLNNSDAVVTIANNTITNYKGADADYIKVSNGNNVTIENNLLAVGANDVDELKNAFADGAEAVRLSAGTYTFPASSLQAGQTIICEEGTVFTGTSSLNINGATVDGATFKNDGATAITGTLYGTMKNCTFEGYETLRWCYTGAGKSVVFENCVIKTTLRGVHFDEMDGDVTFRNCEINGFNAYSGTGTMTFEGCTFGYDASNYNGLNIYTNTVLKDCTFNYVSGKTNFIDMEGTGKTLTIENCTATLDGAAAQIEDFIGGSQLANNTVIIN